jgi:predicted methyltransferase
MRRSFLLALMLALAACSKPQEQAKAPEASPPEPAASAEPAPAPTADAAAIDAALANTDRFAGDADQDAWRHPADVLKFLELRPGQRVLDYFAAAGYNTELMSRVVGPEGKVIAYNNPEYRKFAEDAPAKRYGANRLPNVTELTTPVEALQLDPASLDAALFVQSYHDLYWRPKKGWPATDPAKALTQLVPALKPGGVVVVVDHVANAGDPTETVNALHRIDPAVIKRDFEAAGLKFEGESPLFANAGDDHTKEVFDKSIRHKTDQVMYKFRKL